MLPDGKELPFAAGNWIREWKPSLQTCFLAFGTFCPLFRSSSWEIRRSAGAGFGRGLERAGETGFDELGRGCRSSLSSFGQIHDWCWLCGRAGARWKRRERVAITGKRKVRLGANCGPSSRGSPVEQGSLSFSTSRTGGNPRDTNRQSSLLQSQIPAGSHRQLSTAWNDSANPARPLPLPRRPARSSPRPNPAGSLAYTLHHR